jgi:ectoine hydroxylase-related dioxygenase (phytanoyl-CoA dioxygenase family)
MISKNKEFIRNKFYKDGFYHYKSFFNESEIKNNHAKILEISKKKNETRIINPHRTIKKILKLYLNKKLVKFVKFLLGYEIKGLQSELFLNPPGSIGHPPHQDDFFINSGETNSLNSWIPMVNTSHRNGTLCFFKGSNSKIDSKLNNFFLNHNKTKNLKFKKKTINCKVGDVIFIANNIFHYSSNNLSKKNRYVVAFGYIKEGCRFTKGKSANRKLTKVI